MPAKGSRPSHTVGTGDFFLVSTPAKGSKPSHTVGTGGFWLRKRSQIPLCCRIHHRKDDVQHTAFSMLIFSEQIVGLDETTTAEVSDKVYAHSVARLLALVLVGETLLICSHICRAVPCFDAPPKSTESCLGHNNRSVKMVILF